MASKPYKTIGQHSVGTIKIPLVHFAYEAESSNGVRNLDPDNVERLLRIFDIEGCDRSRWPVEAAITSRTLLSALEFSGITKQEFAASTDKILHLPPGHSVICIHGKHRLEAGRAHLDADQLWWDAQLFEDLSDSNCIQMLREGLDPKGSPWRDGEIFRQMRLFQLCGDEESAKSWQTKLSNSKSGSKLNDISQLLKSAGKDTRMKSFLTSLDRLLKFRGLWLDFQVGCFHRLLTLRCPEELTSYLELVYACWSKICGIHGESLDYNTVISLEGRFPSLSALDVEGLQRMWHQGLLFGEVKTRSERDQIWTSILSLDCRIPTLRTFLEDTKYLELGAKTMKALLPEKFKGSIQSAFQRLHSGLRPTLEGSDGTPILWAGHFQTGYLQTWLFALRNFPDLTDTQPRKESGKPKPPSKSQSPLLWHHFARLARASGFESPRIRQKIEVDPRRQMCEDFLRRVEPLASRTTEQFEHSVNGLLDHLTTSQSSSSPSLAMETPPLISLLHLPVQRRWGRPFETSFYDDRHFLYLKFIKPKQPAIRTGQKPSITSFAIQREIFLAFFRGWSSDCFNLVEESSDPMDIQMGATGTTDLETGRSAATDSAALGSTTGGATIDNTTRDLTRSSDTDIRMSRASNSSVLETYPDYGADYNEEPALDVQSLGLQLTVQNAQNPSTQAIDIQHQITEVDIPAQVIQSLPQITQAPAQIIEIPTQAIQAPQIIQTPAQDLVPRLPPFWYLGTRDFPHMEAASRSIFIQTFVYLLWIWKAQNPSRPTPSLIFDDQNRFMLSYRPRDCVCRHEMFYTLLNGQWRNCSPVDLEPSMQVLAFFKNRNSSTDEVDVSCEMNLSLQQHFLSDRETEDPADEV